jgi:hypothetical protein
MPKIPDEIIATLVDGADIVEIISQYIPLKRKGSSYEGSCPFHQEKTGSFVVSNAKKRYKCFGCGKTGNVVNFIMEYDKISYVEAIRRLAAHQHIQLDDNFQVKKPKPTQEKNPEALSEYAFKKKPFTKKELSLLGKDITAEHCEKNFSLCSLEYYITKKNEEGHSWKISSNEDYPIFMYDYGTWGKIYQPLSEDYRFTYWGEKPDSWIFADNKTAKLISAARSGVIPSHGAEGSEDERLEHLVICSGGSDALNVCSNGFNVCWLNSETAELEDYEYKKLLAPICKNLYILYDIDDTGVRQANRIALRYLDIKMVMLPEDLRKFKDRKGKPCKDAKDFFMYYRNNHHRNISYYFKMLVQTSLPLCFWNIKYNNKGEFTGYDINNEQLYGFLSASGVYALPNKQEKRGFSYVYVNDNTVSAINEEQLQSFVNDILVRFVKENIEYYNINLINSIHRSNQVKLSSLEKIRKTNLDFKSYGPDYDCLFFKNTTVKVTPGGYSTMNPEKIGKYTYDFSIIDHDFRATEPLFTVDYTKEYKALAKQIESTPRQGEAYKNLKKQQELFPETGKYTLNIRDKEFSYLRYIYNTGQIYWKKRENGQPLTETEKKEEQLHFINKCAALGYMIYRYKDPSRAYMAYGMETEQSEVGKHMGGTGKSMFFEAIKKVRNLVSVDGQKSNIQDNETLFSEVKEGVTDFVYFDDLKKNYDLHQLMPVITGSMEVRALYVNKVTLEFEDSPKFGMTSNHAVSNFDASLRRRIWFLAFCNYYHPEDSLRGVEERSPRTEFGKNLIKDYNEDEMNRFYNFMIGCLNTYLKFKSRINPPMESIEKRNIQRILGDEFIYWAEDYLTLEKIGTDLDKYELIEAYKKTMPEKFADLLKMRTFKEKLQMYCEFKGLIFNPPDLLTTESERERNEIRKFQDGKDHYYFHLRPKADPAPQNTTTRVSTIDGDVELPF